MNYLSYFNLKHKNSVIFMHMARVMGGGEQDKEQWDLSIN